VNQGGIMTVTNIELSSKTSIPIIGFGTWKITNENELRTSVNTALDVGYRHFDTAQVYGNEQYVGSTLAESSVPRDELFVTTKISTTNMSDHNVIPSFDESLEKLQTDYVDLLLLHFPVTDARQPAWKDLESIAESGKAKAIGVSNYTTTHLQELLNDCKIKPAVNQVELHVFLQQPDLIKYCHDNDIAVEAYSPLVQGEGLDNPVLAEIAEKHGKTPAQIMLRWCIERNLIPLPKSAHPERIRQNFEIFDFSLDSDDMESIAGLDKGLRTNWDPTDIT